MRKLWINIQRLVAQNIRGHVNTFLALTHGKHHVALTMLAEGPIGTLLHRYIRLLQMAQRIGDLASLFYQTSLLPSLEAFSKILDCQPQILKVIGDFAYISSVDLQKPTISSLWS